MKNKYLASFIVLTVFIYLIKWLFGVTLLRDEWYYFLIAINAYIICLSSRKFKRVFKHLLLGIGIIVMVVCFILGWISFDNKEYHYMDSPQGQHRLILKKYTKGFRPSGYLEVYEVHFGVFKTKVGNTLYVIGRGPILGLEIIPKENNIIKLGKVYTIGLFNFEWINEDTLSITYIYRDELEDEEKSNAQSIIKLKNKNLWQQI